MDGELLGLNYDEVCDLVQRHLYGFNPVTDQTLSTENVHGVEEAVDELWKRLPVDPHADLPATLTSVDDVGAVCEAQGLQRLTGEDVHPSAWVNADRTLGVAVAAIGSTMTGVHLTRIRSWGDEDGEELVKVLPYVAGSGLQLWHAIQAARCTS